jgi:hypothetical protein
MDDIQLEKLCETEFKEQATLLKAVLEQEGIKTMLEGMEASALGDALDGTDSVHVFVPAVHIENAKKILDQILAAGEETIPAWTCDCGEEVDEGFFVCWSCQAEYKQDEGEDGDTAESDFPKGNPQSPTENQD